MADLGQFFGVGDYRGIGKSRFEISVLSPRLYNNLAVDELSVQAIASAMLNKLTAQHTGTGTFGALLNTLATDNAANNATLTLIRKLQKNDRIVNKTTGVLTIFDDDGTTELVQIQLKNGDGENSYKNVLEWREI